MRTNQLRLSSLAALALLPMLAAGAEPEAPGIPEGQGDPALRRPPRLVQSRREIGPWNRDLDLLRSGDGMGFSDRARFVERGGVPCLTADAQGRLVAVFQWFPFDRREAFDRIAVKFSADGGKTWTEPRRVEFDGLPAEYERQFDPTVVALEDRRLRLYFTSNPGRRRTAIYSAVSTDGLRYAFEPGERFGVENEGVVDCAVARLGGSWHLFAPVPREEGRGYHAVSGDGLKFERLTDVRVPVRGTWIGNVMTAGAGLRFYGSGADGVWSASSGDGAVWELDGGSRARGGDPAAWQTKDSGWVMIVTGNLRDDAPQRPPWQNELAGMPGDPPRGRSDESSPPDLRGPFGPPSAGGTITASGEYVYVLKDDVIYQFDARSLKFLRQTPVPTADRRMPRPVEAREDRPRRQPQLLQQPR